MSNKLKINYYNFSDMFAYELSKLLTDAVKTFVFSDVASTPYDVSHELLAADKLGTIRQSAPNVTVVSVILLSNVGNQASQARLTNYLKSNDGKKTIVLPIYIKTGKTDHPAAIVTPKINEDVIIQNFLDKMFLYFR